jgi:peptidylprolyl isomerase
MAVLNSLKLFNINPSIVHLTMLAFFLARAFPKIEHIGQGLKKEIRREGTGLPTGEGRKVAIHYVGKLKDGTKFDSSRDRGEPFEFIIGQGVVLGFSVAVATMHVGEIAVFLIPPEIAYGDKQVGAIPPNSTLIFEIELLRTEY